MFNMHKPCFTVLGIVLFMAMILTSCTSENSESNFTENSYPENLRDFLSEESLSNASIGILLADAETGEVIIQHNPKQGLVPASVQKLLIAGAILEAFGPNFTFETKLVLDGKTSTDGTFTGDIIIVGGGDPAFASPRFNEQYVDVMQKFTQAIADQGIKKVKGKVIGDASLFGVPQISDTWIWEDIGNYYGATASSLNMFENTYRLSFSSGKAGSITRVIKVDPKIPFLEFENYVMASAENRDNAYIYGSYLSNQRELRGTIPAHRKSFSIKGAIPDPALLAAFQLTDKLEAKGIEISGQAESAYQKVKYKQARTILSIPSPPLSEIVYYLNMNSINLYAETLLLHLAKKISEKTDIESACKVLKEFWGKKGMETRGMFLEDGSGLSRANALNAEHLNFLLKYMKNESEFTNEFVQSLPVAGISGSLKNLGGNSSLQEKFIAKSGYMARVMNYAGYLESDSGDEFAVVVMVNNYTCSNAEMRILLEDLISGFTVVKSTFVDDE